MDAHSENFAAMFLHPFETHVDPQCWSATGPAAAVRERDLDQRVGCHGGLLLGRNGPPARLVGIGAPGMPDRAISEYCP